MLPSTNIKSVNELGVRKEYGAVATGNDQQLIADLSRSQQDLKIERKRLDKRVAERRRASATSSRMPRRNKSKKPTRTRRNCFPRSRVRSRR